MILNASVRMFRTTVVPSVRSFQKLLRRASSKRAFNSLDLKQGRPRSLGTGGKKGNSLRRRARKCPKPASMTTRESRWREAADRTDITHDARFSLSDGAVG